MNESARIRLIVNQLKRFQSALALVIAVLERSINFEDDHET